LQLLQSAHRPRIDLDSNHPRRVTRKQGAGETARAWTNLNHLSAIERPRSPHDTRCQIGIEQKMLPKRMTRR
jgi:hypothetical protein